MSNIWSYNERHDQVVKCSYKCEKEHEHYIGTYEKAMVYFKGFMDSNEGKKRLKDIAIFHQLSENTLTKSSAELYDIMVRACSSKEYWVPEKDRHNVVMDTLEICDKEYLIKDDDIFKKARSEEGSNKRLMKRLYRQEQWERIVKYR